MIYNPVNGESGKAAVRQADGRTEVYLQLASGESLLLKTFAGSDIQASAWNYWHPASEGKKVPDRWGFRFVESTPVVTAVPDSVELDSWTELSANEVKNTMGTACYSLNFILTILRFPNGCSIWGMCVKVPVSASMGKSCCFVVGSLPLPDWQIFASG